MRAAVLVLLVACSGNTNKVGVYNTPPSVSITSPPSGAEYDEGSAVAFEAIVDDDFDAPQDLTVTWSSDRDGELQGALPADGSGLLTYTTASLTAGNHVVSVQVVDTDGESATDTVELTIGEVADAPTISVVHPASGESCNEGEEFKLVATVSDEQDDPTALVVDISSDLDGDLCQPTPDAVGVAECEVTLSGGDHTLTFKVTDSTGLTDEEVVYFAVTSTEDVDDDDDGWTETQGDCNDADASVNPGATEYYNGRDDDCDGVIDDGTAGYDDDGDGYSELDEDCDDTDASVYPDAPETYNATDDDCDGTIDEGTEGYDDDGDTYTEIAGDCDDADAATHPGATELADGADNDCDGTIDEGTSNYDDDGDGYSESAGDCDDTSSSVSPAATETCGDGVDNNCSGASDEEGASGCVTYYYDYDLDAYGSSSVAGKCLCSTSGYYSSRYNTDCYDYNSSANPTATSYYTSNRGDGSYDYNCDGSATQYYTSGYSCSSWPLCGSFSSGWKSSTPSCGSSGTWVSGCSLDWTGCDLSTSSVTQACR